MKRGQSAALVRRRKTSGTTAIQQSTVPLFYRVDVTVCSPEAKALARHLLPEAAVPRLTAQGHLCYSCTSLTPVPTKRYRDPCDGTLLVSVACYPLAPTGTPPGHPASRQQQSLHHCPVRRKRGGRR